MSAVPEPAQDPATTMVQTSAFALPVFRQYYAARATALVGNALTVVAMPLLAYRLTGSATLTGLVASAAFWPYLAFGLIAGALADRINRRKVMVYTGLASSVLLASVPAAYVTSTLTYPQLLIVEFGVASLFVFGDAAAFGVLPLMAGRSGLASATSALMVLSTGSQLIGPAVAGILISVVDPALVIAADSIAYLVASLVIARLRWAGNDVVERDRPPHLTQDIVDGLLFIWRLKMLRWLTIFGFGASLALGGVRGLLVVIGVQQLGLADDSPHIGWLFAASAAGTLVGTLAVAPLQRYVGIGRITSVGLGLSFLLLLALSTATSLPVALALIALSHAPLMALILNAMVARSVITPDEYQSRVNTTGRMIAGGGSPFGAVIGGVVADAAGTGWGVRAVGVGLAVSLIGILAVGAHRYPLVRSLRPAQVSGRGTPSSPAGCAAGGARPSCADPTTC